MKRFVVLASVWAIAASCLVLGAVPANAQAATDLKCRGCVGKVDLGRKAVKGKSIRRNAVRRRHIADRAVDATKLAENATPAAVGSVAASGEIVFDTTVNTVLSQTVTLETSGQLMVTASWSTELGPGVGAICGLTFDSTTLDDLQAISTFNPAGAGALTFIPGGMVDVYAADAGAHTVRLLCKVAYGGAEATLIAGRMATLYVPGAL